ncbi:type III restriction protein res subunit (plasmid) [Nitrosococcus halophilus Nc 4]|uniref:Type III restriction protein res subunit n=1 Tax=Nitrosococcus halophilus (strain Nc4) TaxID=472759 RepID=D5C5B8_NITHN|nr:DEAD/DEAH box helicase family protein [Nitrosococcus halophilus]ADE16972.1 type III restriction protein res subunit [Nitrosococcus halophilus Nc 4]
MASNFDFLTGDWAPFREDALHTEQHALTAPRTCAFYARRTLEKTVRWLYAHDPSLRKPYQDNLAALIHEPTFQTLVAPSLFPQIRLIHKVGNQAVHSDVRLRPVEGLQLTRATYNLLSWLVRVYTPTQGAPLSVPPFNDQRLREPLQEAQEADKNAVELSRLQETLQEKDEAFKATQQRLTASQEEIERLKAHIAEVKAENQAALGTVTFEESEAETRDLFIDVLLREAGWDPAGEQVREYAVEGMPHGQGRGYVDYVLWGDNGLPLAIVEAKRTQKSPMMGQRQAELYADCLEQMTGQRPLIYTSNGYQTWLWDDTFYPPREVQGFATKDELQLMVHRRTSRKDLTQIPLNREIAGRYYQEEGLRRVMERFQEARARGSLLVMATGTGKTRVSIAAVEFLMRARWVQRVLFLADRTALVRQAKGAFAAHLPHASLVNLVTEKEEAGSRIVFSTYHTMMNLIDETQQEGRKRFGVNAFDLIIIDEAHRSVYQKFKAIFDYFDSFLLGLTATPKAEVDRNTYHLFDLEDHVPTYAYELNQAVADEYLVPPRPVSVPLKFQRQGIRYEHLSEEEKDAYEATFLDEETGQLPPEIDAAALNAWLFNQDTVDKVLAQLMAQGLKIQGGDQLGKTIIFAKNHDHAEFIVQRFDQHYPHLAGKFCRVIDNRVSYAQSLIDDFTLPHKAPFIAVSVDMLDTGIDVPEVVNLVFFKRVRSKTKFWQMLGRGTRLCPDLFGPGRDKPFFCIFDYCENLEFFSAHPEEVREAPLQESVKQKVFKSRLALATALQAMDDPNDSRPSLQSALLDQLHEGVTRMNLDNFLVRPHRQYVEAFSDRTRWQHLTPSDELEIAEHLSGLPSPDEDDEFARRFDLLILNLQLALLEKTPSLERYQAQVKDLAQGLEEKRAIPAVNAHMPLILDLQSDEYWQDMTLAMLETVRRQLRDLIKFVDKAGPREKVYTDFEDELGEVTEIEGLIQADPSLKHYRLKVETFLRTHQDHVTLQRLRHNQPITAKDLEGLEAVLFSEAGPGSKEDFMKTYGEAPLGELIRRIVGLDRNAAKEAFAEFLSHSTLRADQIRFIDQIIEHLARNGVMDLEALYEPPFTDIHYEGIDGVLPEQADKVIAIIKKVNKNARVA